MNLYHAHAPFTERESDDFAVQKLRKHIRAKRLENIAQLGVDRVVDFRFGSGEGCHHIILEMYAGGNIILTDQT